MKSSGPAAWLPFGGMSSDRGAAGPVRLCGAPRLILGVVEIPLTRGYVALIGEADWPLVGHLKWRALPCKSDLVYAVREERGQNILMHRLLLGLPPARKPVVDHINGDGLDNRRGNIRACSQSLNGRNRRATRNRDLPKGVGVEPRCTNRPFVARLFIKKRMIRIGYFASAVEAALAYDQAAKQMFGEFARLNFPTSDALCHVTDHGEGEIRDVRNQIAALRISI